MKKLVSLLLFGFLLCSLNLNAQYNPYLDKKAKKKPSAVMARQNKKDLRKQKKVARKHMRRSKRRLNKK
jgi:hypothetical protein